LRSVNKVILALTAVPLSASDGRSWDPSKAPARLRFRIDRAALFELRMTAGGVGRARLALVRLSLPFSREVAG
jgi:hypothetical protein